MLIFAVARVQPASAATKKTRIEALVRNAIAHHGLKAVILQITKNGKPLVTNAYGYSMTGVPATTKMHFRNGASRVAGGISAPGSLRSRRDSLPSPGSSDRS